jgi:hypothetical protein
MEKRQCRATDIVSIAISLITLITVISAGFFWFYKTDELPNRVDKTEARLDKLENQMIENSTKTELIYQGVLEIRSVLLKR